MNILVIHQNFPGQFKFLAPALVARGHRVVALCINGTASKKWNGVELVKYSLSRGNGKDIHPWVVDFESKVIRGEACFSAAVNLKKNGFTPDIILAHPGWGESLFLKEVWPKAILKIYCEFYYRTSGFDVGFDPEFSAKDSKDSARVILKNANTLLHLESADSGLSPTYWQASSFPNRFREKITVAHDGIDTSNLTPKRDASLKLTNDITIGESDEVVTYVSRTLEPYRGFHIFLRSLPRLLSARKNLIVVIVGADTRSGYGAPPSNGQTWKELLWTETIKELDDRQLKRVIFAGNLKYESFITLLQVSDAHVYLTYPFVLSWSLLEAMSIGCPVIASNTAPLEEVIEHKRNGLVVDFFKPEDLADSIDYLLNDKALREKIGVQARQTIINNYELNQICLPKQISWVEL